MAMNMAVDLASSGKRVTLVDVDVVNPYFRSSDYMEFLQKRGVQVIAPYFAASNLDAPSLPAEMYATLEPSWPADTVIWDVGGEDAGATALGRFSQLIAAQPYRLFYVINRNRPQIARPGGAVSLLREIEAAARLKASGVVNNTHLQGATTLEDVLAGEDYGVETAKAAGLPLAAATFPAGLLLPKEVLARWAANGTEAYPVKRYVLSPWETGVV